MPMQFYMRLKDIPELAALPPADRYRAWFQCVRHSPCGLRAWAAFLLVFVPFGLAFLYPVWWMLFVVAPVLSLPLIANFNRVQVEQLRPHFRELLTKRA